jgi:O-antigen biosynthesis protein
MEAGAQGTRSEGTEPPDRLTTILQMAAGATRVADLGCGPGTLARQFQERGCSVTGVEIDAGSAAEARPYCDELIVADLEAMDLAAAFSPGSFDAVIFADVIEHLKDPRRVLNQVRDLLSPGGCIIVSVPNVAHVSVRLELLKGQFSYEETGILDDTHLRYYTRSSITDLLQSCGYMVELMDWVERKITDRELHEALDPLGMSDLSEVAKAFSEWEAIAYQYVIKAFPASEDARLARISEEKVQAERKLKVLKREVEDLRNDADAAAGLQEQLAEAKREIARSGDYVKSLERKIAEKDAFIEQLQSAVSESRKRLDECEVEISGMAKAFNELEAARQPRGRRRR